KSSSPVVQKKEPLPKEENEQAEVNNDDVYAKLALKHQQDELAKLNQDDSKSKKNVDENQNRQRSKQKKDNKADAESKVSPRRRNRVYSPPIRNKVISRRILPPPPPPRRTVSIPKTVEGTHRAAKLVNENPNVEKDPIAQLAKLRSVGSFGSIDYQKESNTNKRAETFVASSSPMYKQSAVKALHRQKTMDNSSSENIVRTVEFTNGVEQIKPKWQPKFDRQPSNKNSTVENVKSTKVASALPNNAENRKYRHNVYSPANHIHLNSSQMLNRLASIGKQKKSESSPNHEQVNQGDKRNFVEAIKLAKKRTRLPSNYYSSNFTYSNNYLTQEERILQADKPKYLVVGEHAKGRLLTPLVQHQQPEGQQQSNARFVAKLAQDIHDNRGAIAIPRGTLLAVKINTVDGASAADVEVVAIIKNETEYPIPPGTISVYGNKGKPLIAKQFKDKGGEIAKYDATVGIMGGLAKAGQIINQPEDEETIEDPLTGRIRNVRRNSRRSIGGAIIEGAFGEMTDIVKKRAETSTREIIARPNVWYIPAKTKLMFVVNHSMRLPNQL
ncbi:MAG: hypothetical protein AAFR37_08120, partial [Cyanobacteria bacterium J06628_3]